MTSSEVEGMPEQKVSIFRRFSSVFWIVQIFELMERGAYYSMMPILAVHFYWNVGIPQWLALILTVFMYPFQYGMPILSSALGEKVGYKKQMTIGFIVLFFAYIFLSFANNVPMAIAGVMLLGFGIGTYKPLVSSTIAKATHQKDRNVAYSVYYWTVNFAATFFALFWGILLITGVMQESMYAWVFRISSVFFLVNILVALFIFKEIPRSGEVRTVRDVGNNIKTAFSDRKFVLMVLLIAGFWALYSTTLAPFQTIMYGFHFLPKWFPVILLGVFNPGTIILLGLPLARFVEKIESLKAVMGGILIYLIGLAIITFFLQYPPLAILGIFIYSIGEFMVAPGYLSFVSKLAPKEKVSAYIGTNFLASFIGIQGGALIFGLLTSFVAIGLNRPHFFYGLLMSYGLVILILFILYYRAWGQEIIGRAKTIEMEEHGSSYLDSQKKQKEPILFSLFDKKISMYIAGALIPVLLISTFMMGTNEFFPPEDDDDGDGGGGVIFVEDTVTYSHSDFSGNGESTPFEFGSIGQPVSVSVSLKWTDESVRIFQKNDPDTFQMRLTPPNGSALDPSDASDSGSISMTRVIDANNTEEYRGTWTLYVDCVQAGPISTRGPLGLIQWTDDGNDWEATVVVTYLIEEE